MGTRSSADLNRLLHVWTVLKPCHGALTLLTAGPYVLTRAYDITTNITISSSSPPVRAPLERSAILLPLSGAQEHFLVTEHAATLPACPMNALPWKEANTVYPTCLLL